MNLSEQVNARLRTGNVVRYHTAPHIGRGQNLADHCWRVMVLLQTLFPSVSRAALLYAMYHDAAEHQLGDMPAPAKWTYPELADVYRKAEYGEEEKLGVVFETLLTPREKLQVQMCDMLELVITTANAIKGGSRDEEVVKCYRNGVKYLYQKFEQQEDFPRVLTVLQSIQNDVDRLFPNFAAL